MISQNVTLSLKRFGVAPVIHAVQNDTGREVVARFTDLELVAGMTGKLSFTRSDGTHYEHTAVIDTTAQTVTAELDQALTQDGQTRCQIKITDADGIQSAFTFIVDVQPDMAGLSQEQDGWRVEEITDRLDAVEEAIEDKQDRLTAGTGITIEQNVISASYGVDQYVLDHLDGTLTTYKNLMRYWFGANLHTGWTSAELTALCDRWYELVRPIWDGGARFAQPDYSTSSFGTKVGDNEGLVCNPSSNTVHGASDYEGNPLFIPTDVNFIVDAETREPIITAIDGITSNFTRYNSNVFVGVMQMTGWVAQTEESEIYTIWYSSTQGRHEGSKPLSEAVRFSDNTVRPWVVHSKYGSQTIDGKMTSFSGGLPTSFNISHNTLHTLAAATGTGYSGMCYCDQAFLYLMNAIKYASMTADGTMMQGCVNSNWQYPALVAETGVKRILVTVAEGANIHEGMQVLVGDTAGNLDRGQAAMRSISGADGCKVVAKNTVTIDGTEYAAITVDVANVFDTTANGASVSGTTYISSFGWACGANDNILGFDGNCLGSTSGNAPSTIQGIEYMNGKYEVIADTILDLYQDGDDYFYEPKIVKNTSNQATSVTANYVATGLKCKQPASSSWRYIKKLGYAEGMFFPIEVGASASTYTRDGFYMNAATTGTREARLFGSLNYGSGNGGLSYVDGYAGLSSAYWHLASRLSPNGNRGEFAA